MKRFSGREMALLCSPVLLIALVGWLLSRRSPDAGHLNLRFHVEQPSVLEAFGGSDAVLVVDLAGPDAGMDNDKWRIWQCQPSLEVQTPTGVQTSKSWGRVWKGTVNSTRFLIDSQAIPVGQLRFGANAALWSSPLGATGKMPRLSRSWTVNRTQFKPFVWSKMSPAPLVRLSSVAITQVRTSGSPMGDIEGVVAFDLTGSAMNVRTPFDVELRERRSSFSCGPIANLKPHSARQRVWRWTLYHASTLARGQKQTFSLSGRVSANHRWPLAFQIEPFDLSKVKVGQKLTFKSWPAPVPTR